MANGLKGFKGAISDKELEVARRLAAGGGPRKNGRLKKLLGMTQRPTAAGQARFGDVDVGGGGSIGSLSDAEAAMVMSLGRQPNRPRGALSAREAQMAKLQAQSLGDSARY